jgi:opine dehydrogenase
MCVWECPADGDWKNNHLGAPNKAIQAQTGYNYNSIVVPHSLNHRYICEDIPMRLVPIAALCSRHGVSVRGIESIIRPACFVHQTEY